MLLLKHTLYYYTISYSKHSRNLVSEFQYFNWDFTSVPDILWSWFEETGKTFHNRLRDAHLTQDTEMKHGGMKEHWTDYGKLVVVQWNDSKAVKLHLAVLALVVCVCVCGRCSTSEKQYDMVPSPGNVHSYNQCKGHVDIWNQLMEAYRTLFKVKTLPLKVILHFTNTASVNVWRLFKMPDNKEGNFWSAWN
jgi:hypothetical protein